MDKTLLRKAVRQNNILWNKHSFEKMMERNISRKNVVDTILKGEIIEDYPNDKPYPSALFFFMINKYPLHVVASLDEKNELCYIITAYHPDLKHFKTDFKTRIKNAKR